MEAWETERLEYVFERWLEQDDPPHEDRVATLYWLIALRSENPRPASSAPVPGAEADLWLAEVPGTNVLVLYGIDEDNHRLVFFTIDTV